MPDGKNPGTQDDKIRKLRLPPSNAADLETPGGVPGELDEPVLLESSGVGSAYRVGELTGGIILALLVVQLIDWLVRLVVT